jgi:hypothetical protein
VTTLLLAEYEGEEDRELDRALDRAVGKLADWAGKGRERGRIVRELGWEFLDAEEASAAAARASGGVSRSGLRLRLRQKGM